MNTYTWDIDWTKVKNVEDIKLILQSFDLRVISQHPDFEDLIRLCKMIDSDGYEVDPETKERILK